MAMVALVRPWKDPWKTITFGRWVACRASFTAPSIASAPELVKKNVSSGLRHDRQQLFHQAQHGLMRHQCRLPVEQPGRLLLDGLDHARVGVPGVGHPDPAGEVQIAAAGGVDQVGALAVIDHERPGTIPHGGEVR